MDHPVFPCAVVPTSNPPSCSHSSLPFVRDLQVLQTRWILVAVLAIASVSNVRGQGTGGGTTNAKRSWPWGVNSHYHSITCRFESVAHEFTPRFTTAMTQMIENGAWGRLLGGCCHRQDRVSVDPLPTNPKVAWQRLSWAVSLKHTLGLTMFRLVPPVVSRCSTSSLRAEFTTRQEVGWPNLAQAPGCPLTRQHFMATLVCVEGRGRRGMDCKQTSQSSDLRGSFLGRADRSCE